MKKIFAGIFAVTISISANAGSAACIGNPDPVACEAFEAKLALETPTQKADRAHRLEKSRQLANAQVLKQAAVKAKDRGVSISMSQSEVRASSWGLPQRVNRTTTASGVTEQWVYGNRNYLYFRDDKLTSIQN